MRQKIRRLKLEVVGTKGYRTTTSIKMPEELPSVEEEKQLREMVQEHKRLNDIAGFFGKSPASIKMKISRLGLVVVVLRIQQTTTSNKQRKKGSFFCSCLTSGSMSYFALLLDDNQPKSERSLSPCKDLRLHLVVVDQSQTARTTTTCVALVSRHIYPLQLKDTVEFALGKRRCIGF